LVINSIWREKISSRDSAKAPAVGNASSFGKRTICAEFSGMRDDVARNRRKGQMDGWTFATGALI
jgi:hypothetical protein